MQAERHRHTEHGGTAAGQPVNDEKSRRGTLRPHNAHRTTCLVPEAKHTGSVQQPESMCYHLVGLGSGLGSVQEPESMCYHAQVLASMRSQACTGQWQSGQGRTGGVAGVAVGVCLAAADRVASTVVACHKRRLADGLTCKYRTARVNMNGSGRRS